MGPRLDDTTLGTLGATEFFGELSLLPIEGGWSHRRTAMVMQNAMLHTLSKTDVQTVSDRFVELRHRLVDHAEDYQRVQAATAAAADIENLSTIKAKKVTTGRGMVVSEKDPLAILKAQLSHQDAKLEQLSGTACLLSTTTPLHRPRRTHARTPFFSRAHRLCRYGMLSVVLRTFVFQSANAANRGLAYAHKRSRRRPVECPSRVKPALGPYVKPTVLLGRPDLAVDVRQT